MKFALLILILGVFFSCGGNGNQRILPAPSIYVNSRRKTFLEVSLGESVDIVCRNPVPLSLDFYLEKDGQNMSMLSNQILKTTFSITNVSRDHGGMYTCRISDSNLLWSKPSEPLELLINDPDLPKPNISLSPSNVAVWGVGSTIWCWVDDLSERFYLHRRTLSSLRMQSAEPDGAIATFPIGYMNRTIQGSYQCTYKPQSKFSVSRPSNHVEVFRMEPGFEKPTVYMHPLVVVALGGNVTVHCRSQPGANIFYFQKPADPPSHLFTVTDKTTDKFLMIRNVSWEHSGKYRCSYGLNAKNYVLSEPSDAVALLITAPELPRPNISVIPSRMAVLGSNVTIQCWVKGPSKMFYLHKTGETSQLSEPNGDMANFFIRSVNRDHGGNYSCSYTPPSSVLLSSDTSDTMELLVLDPFIRKPTIFLNSTELIPRGGNVTFYCHTQESADKIYLQKAGDQTPHQLTETNDTMAKFTIFNASFNHGGNYSCRYGLKSMSYLISPPSDPVVLLIKDPDLPRPNISLSPNKLAVLGSNVTIQCWAKGPIQRFYLGKAGHLVIPHSADPERDVAEFTISNVTLEHSGSYRCNYSPLSEFFISSDMSYDDVKLVFLGANLTKPVITIRPSGLVALKRQISIQCEIQNGPAKFYLHKAGEPTAKWPMKSDWDVGTHSISNVSWEHQGNYSCSYALDERPFLFSAPSDPVELLVSDCTQINTIRFAIGGLILLLLACIMIEDQRFGMKCGLYAR